MTTAPAGVRYGGRVRSGMGGLADFGQAMVAWYDDGTLAR